MLNSYYKSLVNSLSFYLVFISLNLVNPLTILAQDNKEMQEMEADNMINIDYDTPAFNNQNLEGNEIKISVNYEPYNYNNTDENYTNLSYQIYYDNQLKVTEQKVSINWGEISLQDFNNDRIPEVIISTYSGGAHCCANHLIYTWQNNQFIPIDLGFRDARGGIFQDIDQDGNMEFLTVDNAFLYRFSSYAGSFPPTMIFTFKNANFENVTTQYPNELRKDLESMYKSLFEIAHNHEDFEVNGIWAGYLAQKILLNEYAEGWEFMLQNYDKTSDWGLDIYDVNGEVVGQYPDFPTALKAFLIEQKYLNSDQ